MENPLTARRGWLIVGGVIVGYEAACPKGELLSEGVDRALECHPWVVRAAVGAVALHLLNVLPDQIDPIHQIARALKG